MRGFLPSMLGIILLCTGGKIFAASSSPVDVLSIEIDPKAPAIGQRPSITARIARSRARETREPLVVNVIAVVTRPDNVTTSATWRKETFERRQRKEYVLSRIFDADRPGRYRVEFIVYSADMRRRFTRRTTTFTVGVGAPPPAAAARSILGIGAYGNALNPSGGGTILLWPHDRVGLQGSYTVGTFTVSEVRLLVRFGTQGGIRPYAGVGFAGVTRETEVIGVTTEFKDRGVFGVVGAEIPLSRRVLGYAEVSGSAIKLERSVSNGGQTVIATVDHAPVTICAGIVFYVF